MTYLYVSKILLLLTIAINVLTQYSFAQTHPLNIQPIELFKAIDQRLDYMPDVATYKYINDLAITDKVREKKVIDAAIKSAKPRSINTMSMMNFTIVQMSIAKAIQHRVSARLMTQNTIEQPRDLKRTIRPKLIQLGETINKEIQQYLIQHKSFDELKLDVFKQYVSHPDLTQQDIELLFYSLKEVSLK